MHQIDKTGGGYILYIHYIQVGNEIGQIDWCVPVFALITDWCIWWRLDLAGICRCWSIMISILLTIGIIDFYSIFNFKCSVLVDNALLLSVHLCILVVLLTPSPVPVGFDRYWSDIEIGRCRLIFAGIYSRGWSKIEINLLRSVLTDNNRYLYLSTEK